MCPKGEGRMEAVGSVNNALCCNQTNTNPLSRGMYCDPLVNTLQQRTNAILDLLGTIPTMNFASCATNSPFSGIPGNCMSPNNQSILGYANDPNIRELAQDIHSSFRKWPFRDRRDRVSAVLEKLSNENPRKLAALELAYGQMYGEPDKLRKDIRSNFAGVQGLAKFSPLGLLNLGKPDCKEIRFLNKAAKVSPLNSSLALHEAMHGIGTDERTVKDIVYNNSDNMLAQTTHYYRMVSGGDSLQNDIRKDFRYLAGGPEENLLTRIDLALAGAY